MSKCIVCGEKGDEDTLTGPCEVCGQKTHWDCGRGDDEGVWLCMSHAAPLGAVGSPTTQEPKEGKG